MLPLIRECERRVEGLTGRGLLRRFRDELIFNRGEVWTYFVVSLELVDDPLESVWAI